jgi:hypothetical protein
MRSSRCMALTVTRWSDVMTAMHALNQALALAATLTWYCVLCTAASARWHSGAKWNSLRYGVATQRSIVLSCSQAHLRMRRTDHHASRVAHSASMLWRNVIPNMFNVPAFCPILSG